MSDTSVFETVSTALVECLRETLSPGVLNSPDAVRLTYPGAEEDFRLGVYLYDIEEIRPGGGPSMVRVRSGERQFPSLTLSLHFLVFANRKAAFHGVEAGDELLLLEAAMRCVQNTPELVCGEDTVKLFFQEMKRGDKTSFWQSISCPLQPAVYLTAEPVALPNSRLLRVPEVRHIDVKAQQKGEKS